MSEEHYVTWTDFKEFRTELLSAVNRIGEKVNDRSRFNWSAASVFLGLAGMASALVIFAIRAESSIREVKDLAQDNIRLVQNQLIDSKMEVIDEKIIALTRAKQLHVERLEGLIEVNRQDIDRVVSSRFSNDDGDRLERQIEQIRDEQTAYRMSSRN